MRVGMTHFPYGRRGERPLFLAMPSPAHAYRFASAIPGVVARGSAIHFSVEAAPALEALLSVALSRQDFDAAEFAAWLPGREEYDRLFKPKLRDYQRDMVSFLALRAFAINGDPMRCLAGSTKLRVHRAGKTFTTTLVRLAKGLQGRLGWRLDIPTKLQSMDEQGSIVLNTVTLVHQPGYKHCLTLKLADGSTLTATPDHRIATSHGMKLLGDLKVGQTVLVAVKPTKRAGRVRNLSRYLQGMKHHPHAEHFKSVRKDRPVETGYRVKTHRLAAEAALSGLPYKVFVSRVRASELEGLRFLPPDMDVHHLDGNHANNAPENLQVMTRAEHARRHGQEGGWRSVSMRAVSVEVVSIEDAGVHETFDLTMANPLNNYVAGNVVVSNSGKTPTTLAAASLIGSEKTLIVCPSIAKLVWATEIAKWLGMPSLILYGRGADEARAYCLSCEGKGRDTTGSRCAACKAKNGSSYGYRIFRDAEVPQALAEHRFVIANYDILIPQARTDPAGKRELDATLGGWSEALRCAPFDLAIVDEAHVLRGRSTRERRGESKRDRLVDLSKGIERVWALSGTPIYGRVADLWSLLDYITDGLYGRPFFTFDVRYAGGGQGQYGWVNDGATNVDELKSRLDTFMLKRDRRDIMPFMPPKTRQIVRLDSGKANFSKPKGTKGSSGLHAALRATARIKADAVVENVATECREGAKVVVYAYLRENAEALAKALAAACDKGEHSVPLKARHFRVWAVSGDTPVEARFKQAQAFREWQGAGVFVATIDSVPVAISLKGAQSVHFSDLNFDPASLLQAEDRPYEVGTTGLTIVYYVVEKTVDEHVVGLVLPKMEMLSNVVNETAAGDFKNAFGGVDPEALAEEVWARMAAAAV